MNVYKSLAEALLSGKPYVGPALRAMQGVPERHQYFRPVVSCVARQRAGKGLEVLEIGSWAGASTLTWALALLQADAAGSVTCIDPWEPYFDVTKNTGEIYEDMNAATRHGLIVRLFEHNIRAAGVDTIVRAHRGRSRDVLPTLPDDSFDIIYIDGSHEFEDVCFDIDQAKRLVRHDGIICGDDLELEAAAVPEDELREAIKQNLDFDYSEAAKAHYHPGVTGAVAREFGAVGVWDGFWGIQRCGGEWIPPVLDLTALSLPDHIRSAAEQLRLVGRSETLLPPRKPASPVPVLTGSYRGYNLVAYNDRIYALQTSLGPVDATEGEAELERRFGRERVLFTDTNDVAKARIDSLETARELAGHAAATTENLRSQQSQIDKIGAALEDLGTATEALSRQCRLVSGQVGMLQFGPGEPQTPCVSGQHRDFELVHYQGRVYALRRPLEPGAVLLGEQELLERHHSGDVVVGDSLDGVRARIDVLEGLKEVQAQVSSLDQELSNSGSHLTGKLREMLSEISSMRDELMASSSRLGGDLQQADATLQSHARNLERLARSWPNRLLGILPR